MRVHGIDVSTHQDNPDTPQVIDWSKPKTRHVRFVINRLTNAATIDADFVRNYTAQAVHGYVRGAYGWWDYRIGAAADAVQGRAFGEVERAYPSEMPVIWGDWEKPGADWPPLPPRAQCLAKMKLYKDAGELASGKRMGAYMNLAMIQYLTSENGVFVPLPAWLRVMPLWIAAWPKLPAGMTLEAFIDYIERLGFTPNTLGQWERATFWQAGTPAYGLELGMDGSKDIDWDVFFGSEEQFTEWLKEGEMMANLYKDNAIGYYAKTPTDSGWGNPGYHFYVLAGGAGYEQPNQVLKPMEEKARAQGKQVLIEYRFSMAYYTENQYPLDPAMWPDFDQDYPLQTFADICKPRNADGYIITVLDPNDHSGKPGNAAWLNFTMREFINKAKEIAEKAHPGVKVYVRTSHAFLAQYAPGALAWIHQHETIVDQQLPLGALDESYPPADTRPAHIGASDGWEFVSYRPTLYLYKGTAAQLAAALGKPTQPPPADTTPPTAPAGLTAQVAGSTVVLNWQPSTDSAGGAVGYHLFENGVQTYNTTSPTFTLLNKPAGTYQYQVEAYDAAGNRSAKSNTVSVTVATPPPPQDLTAILARLDAAESAVRGLVELTKVMGDALKGADTRQENRITQLEEWAVTVEVKPFVKGE
jgi:GH25 family lysozyme M1 (1,4-beta-N-acetylmuramidase)